MTFSNAMAEDTSAEPQKTKKPSKDKIFLESAKLFATKGYHGTSVRDIAKAAEVNVALINYHFKSKENLFLQVVQFGYQELNNEVHATRGQSVNQMLTHFYKISIDMSGTAYYLAVVFSMFTGGFDGPETFTQDVLNEPTDFENFLAEAIEREYGKSKNSPDVTKVANYIVFNAVNTALVRFGLGDRHSEGFIPKLFPESNEPQLATLLDLSDRLCKSL